MAILLPANKDYPAFEKAVLAALPPYRDDIDALAIPEQIYNCFCFYGFSLEDTIAYLKLTEHVNPDLDEDFALKEMAKIHLKYHHLKQ